MYRTDFNYDLPNDLVAQYPLAGRSQSRLLCLDGASARLEDRQFLDLISILNKGDLLVFNDTRVIPARLYGKKTTGGKVEILVERLLDKSRLLAQIRASKAPKINGQLKFGDEISAIVENKSGEFYTLYFEGDKSVSAILSDIGHMPLPPYITRKDEEIDQQRYQTVYATHDGAVAAPTAGLHFDHNFIDELQNNGINIGFVTLHVGAGTFQPLRVQKIEDHKMHVEMVNVSPILCEQIQTTQRQGGRIIAVGTTTVRSLETASQQGGIQPFSGDTGIFITPGYEFRVVDAIITNFHLPESTLLMLVCAFGGLKNVLAAYRHAIEKKYRFYSYGDAMWLTPQRKDKR